MKIAVVGPASPKNFSKHLGVHESELPMGMGGTPVNELVSGLLRAGNRVHLITASIDVEQTRRFSSPTLDIAVVPYRRRARWRAIDLFRKERQFLTAEIRESNADIVHCHWTYEFGWAGLRGKKPLLITAHDAPLTILRYMPNLYRLIRLAIAWRIRFASVQISAVSPYLASAWKRQMLDWRSVPVVPNIVPSLQRMKTGVVAGPVITDIASAERLKNIPVLLRAFSQLRLSYPDAELRLLGAGLGETDSLRSWAIREGLASRVLFLGPQPREGVARHLSETTVFCHPSLEEAQPMSVLEAMRLGVPVVGGRNSGGVPWTLGNGTAGVLADISDSNEVCEVLTHLLGNPSERERIGLAGSKLVNERFSSESVVSGYLDLYALCLQGDARKRTN